MRPGRSRPKGLRYIQKSFWSYCGWDICLPTVSSMDAQTHNKTFPTPKGVLTNTCFSSRIFVIVCTVKLSALKNAHDWMNFSSSIVCGFHSSYIHIAGRSFACFFAFGLYLSEYEHLHSLHVKTRLAYLSINFYDNGQWC